MELLVHGIYDAQTLQTLLESGIFRLGLDLRPRSLNLIPFHVLKTLLPLMKEREVHLIFEEDKEETVRSFLDLLGENKNKFILQFRDQRPVNFYANFHHPFSWMFHPEGEWEEILKLKELKTLILPVKWKNHYQEH